VAKHALPRALLVILLVRCNGPLQILLELGQVGLRRNALVLDTLYAFVVKYTVRRRLGGFLNCAKKK
jgi:hypothetical protein